MDRGLSEEPERRGDQPAISLTSAPSNSSKEISHKTAILNRSAQICNIGGIKTSNS